MDRGSEREHIARERDWAIVMAADTEHTPGDEADDLAGQARTGVAEAVARQLARGAARLAPSALLATLCTGALLPIALADPEQVAVVGLTEIVGGVGVNVLSDVIRNAVEALRRRTGAAALSTEQLESELAGRLEQMLSEDTTQGRLLRSQLAAMVREIGAVEVALRAALESGNREVQAGLAEAFGTLGVQFAEFGFLLTSLDQAAEEIQLTLRRHDAEHRSDRERMRRQSVELLLIREELAALRHGRPAGHGEDHSRRWRHGPPYRGLLTFEADHGPVFHGREQATAALVDKLAERLAAPSIALFTGASGVGKSSLLRAGLLPALARGLLPAPGSERWPHLLLTPTRAPLDELAVHLAAVGRSDLLAVRHALEQGQAHMVVRQAVLAAGGEHGADGARAVIVVDQFEEVFTLAEETGQGRPFIAALAAAAGIPAGPGGSPPALVVIGVRGDFLDRCAAYPALVEAMTGGQSVLGPMNVSELRRAIVGPAAAAGLELEPGLTDLVLRDLGSGDGYGAGALPLLSQAMLATWENRDGDRLTIAGYGAGGGVGDAVRTRAEAVFTALDAEGQALTRRLFQRMTVVSPDGRAARRRVSRTELNGLSERPGVVDAILEAFAGRRLLVLGEESVEIAHDCLLEAWPRLRGWLDDDKTGRLLEGRLLDAAEAWQGHGEDGAFLFRGPQLAAARQRFADNELLAALGPHGQRFLAASVRARSRRVLAAASAAVLLVVALGAAGLGLQVRSSAIERGNQIASRQLAELAGTIRKGDPAAALHLSLVADRIAPTVESRAALYASDARPYPIILAGHTDRVRNVVYSHDGRLLATSGIDKTVRLWDTHDLSQPAPLAVLHSDGPATLAFSKDDHVLVAQTRDTLWVWDVTDSSRPVLKASRPSPSNPWTGVASSPGALVLASVGDMGRVRLWNVGKPADPVVMTTLVPSPVEVYAVAFSPDGQTLATGSGATGGGGPGTARVRLWNVADPRRPVLVVTLKADSVMSLTFSPDGRLLAAGGTIGALKVWDITKPHSPKTIEVLNAPTSKGAVNAVAFAPSGNTFVTADGTGTVSLWNSNDLSRGFTVDRDRFPTSTGVNSVAFSPGGQVVASGDDENVKLWRHPSATLPGSIGASQVSTWGRAFSPDGKLIISHVRTGSDRLQVQIWDVTEPRHPLPGAALPAPWVRAAFMRRSRTLVTQSEDFSAVALWDVRDPRRPVRLCSFPSGGDAPSVTPDERALAVGNAFNTIIWDVTDTRGPTATATIPAEHGTPTFLDDDTLMIREGQGLRLWDVRDRHKPTPAGAISPQEVVDGLAFEKGTRLLAVWTDTFGVKLWDVSDIWHPVQHGNVDREALSVRVSSIDFVDKHTLAVATDNDTRLSLWDVRDPAKPRRISVLPSDGEITNLQVSADGRMAFQTGAALLGSGRAYLWDVSDPGAPQDLGSLPEADALEFSPDGRTIAIEQPDATLRGTGIILMDSDSESIHRYLCSLHPRPLSRDQWEQLVGGIHAYEKPCP
ncbi:hypothetical protein Mame01_50860 [Microbispora amethystogenes]|nr:hypothetical protein Mame01_50860 [Microbispora amethystogenes]